jgi:hypothetical protein
VIAQGLIDADGHAAVPPSAQAKTMMAAYKRSGGTMFC